MVLFFRSVDAFGKYRLKSTSRDTIVLMLLASSFEMSEILLLKPTWVKNSCFVMNVNEGVLFGLYFLK